MVKSVFGFHDNKEEEVMKGMLFVIIAFVAFSFAGVASAENPPSQIFCVPAGDPNNGTTLDITADMSGNIYYTEIGAGVTKLNYQGQPLLTWGAGLFSTPTGIVAGKDGYIYVCDLNNGMVRKFTQNGDHVLSWAIPVFTNFSGPYGIDQAPNGEIYVCDPSQAQILIFTPDGELIRHWSYGVSGYGIGVAVDKNGQLVYVGKRGANVVDVFDTLGNPISTWSTPGCYNLETDAAGFVYVATNTASGVVKYSSGGVMQYSLTTAPNPTGVAINSWGWLYATIIGSVCAYGDGPPIAVKESSWGAIKALYK
ncbi:MAG: NHL repeat-containing protein [Patescibacteria group bacterium]